MFQLDKKVGYALAMLLFVGMVFFGCSNDDSPPQVQPQVSSSSGDEPGCIGETCDPYDPPECTEESCDPNVPPVCTEESCDPNVPPDGSSPSGNYSSSSEAPYVPPPPPPGANCAYMPIWCGSLTFDKVITKSLDTSDVGAEEKGWSRPNCIYATTITQIGNEAGGISINGTPFASGGASRCGGDAGHGYGDAASCATKFNNIAKKDGGYYIYVSAWAGQDFKTIGGTPVCTGTDPGPGPGGSSSSGSGNTGNTGSCVEPMYGVPPGGVKSCVKKGNKCYTCNPDRGNSCNEPWIWQANSIEDWWYVEVSCNEAPPPPTTTNTLTCTGLAQTGVTGAAITQPTVRCDGANVPSANVNYTNPPVWNNPVAGSFAVSATTNCGGSNKTASCGTIVVSTPATNTLTCTGLATTGIAGTAITQPTIRCNNANVTGTFTGAPVWANPVAGSFTVSTTANCGGNKTATCGTIKVNPKLNCGNPTPATVTAGTAVTAPTVTCGTTTVTSGITWSGQPTYWTAPAQGTYNAIKATVNAGDCSGQTATCGTLTVNAKLTCESVTQAITTGQTPTKPKVACGTTTVTSGITWTPASINNAVNTAQTITSVKAAASCGGSNQTADCAGTITVTAPVVTPSSNSGGGTSSPSTGGTTTYVPKSPGGQSGATTQYWDACKPSCGWGGKGGLQANSCSITGVNIGKSDSDRSACDGGNAFTCMNQAPWKLKNASGQDISFGYVAINDGACGTCYQLDFPSGHVMVVMKSNIGNINGTFDMMIPGGGVGDFDALTRQVTNSGVSNPDMGVRYGGFRGQCGWNYSTTSVNCVIDKCNSVFKNLPDLKAGCLWYANTLGNAQDWNNPTVKYQTVTCPAELTGRY